MESHLSEESLWASGLASRLRLIQANFADDPASVRQGYITEEIERALKTVSPTKRTAYLDSLAERFPAWEGVRSAAHSDVQVGAAPLTAEELVARLVELAPTLSPEARTAFAGQLQGAGLSIKESANAFLELPPDLQKKLGLPQGKPLQLERAVKLLIMTTELALALDQLAWALWKQVAPKSTIRKEAELNRLAGAYLAGDAEVSSAQLSQPLEKTRRLIAGLLGAVGRAGSSYAKKYISRLSPEMIEDWAKMEKKWNESIEAACWRKFIQQAKEHASEPAIEHEIQEAIAKAAENLILGRVGG
ncbi:MAG TPA: hypothetical protein VMZ27_06705 [Candidatus Saccharimonadales bacterium]|nr:hypothetical protein [Candidatus Saccharimonadales bacterium]